MTSAEAALLRRLIEADRAYHACRARGVAVHPDDRGVEIGAINGVDPRTARALERHGLVEILDVRADQPNAFLGAYAPLD